jgi:hypothetical protein
MACEILRNADDGEASHILAANDVFHTGEHGS